MRNIFLALLIALALSNICRSDTAKDHLVVISRVRVPASFPPKLQLLWGNGICISSDCAVVATAYHTTKFVGRGHIGIIGHRATKVLSLANASDTNKTEMQAGNIGKLRFDPANDIAFVYTKNPVRHKSGIPYSYHCYVGQKVQITGYRYRGLQRKDAHIIGVNVNLITGKARVMENLMLDIPVEFGDSGSAVLDEQGNLLGMVVSTGAMKFGDKDLKVSMALPVRTIASSFVALDPALGRIIFRDIPEPETFVQAFSESYEESDVPEDVSPAIPHLLVTTVGHDVDDPVGQLKRKADAAAKAMTNLIVKQCLVQGIEKPICHELSVSNDQQVFTKIDKHGQLRNSSLSFPRPNHGVWTQSDWLDTLGEIADNDWALQGLVGDQYLFAFHSTAADDRCYWEEYPGGIPLFSGYHPEWKGPVACFEQVLTDKNFNVLAAYTEMYPPDPCLIEWVQTAIFFDWVTLDGIKAPLLVPVRERVTAQAQGQKDLLYTSITWADYRKFRAEHKIRF